MMLMLMLLKTDLSKLDMPAPLLALCQYVETKLKPANETITVHMPEEMFGTDHDTLLLSEDILQFASMVEIGATVIAVYMSLKKVDGDQFYLVPYNLGDHWVLIIVRPAKETIYYMNSLPNCSVDEDMRNIVNTDHLYFNGIDQSYKIWTWHGKPWEWTTNASRNVEEDECGFSFVSEEVGMDDNDLGDIGFDPYEFANVIRDGD
ncbi:unnamed protein product [Prunus brigantina]